jgi:hypothetical protein
MTSDNYLLDELLDQLDANVLEDALRRQGSKSRSSSSTIVPAAATYPSPEDPYSRSSQTIVPSNSHGNDLILNSSLTDQSRLGDFSTNLLEDAMQLWPTESEWVFQETYLPGVNPQTDYTLTDRVPGFQTALGRSILESPASVVIPTPPGNISGQKVGDKYTISVPLPVADDLFVSQ